MGLMTLNLFSTCCCGYASITNAAVSDVRQGTFEQGDVFGAIRGIREWPGYYSKIKKLSKQLSI